ncbi:MAG TPA: CHAD domain-containing protein [Bryobacteraceae bacterium]|nr:CHAD domain-containing protein [Bryobacteraceae bacterium]
MRTQTAVLLRRFAFQVNRAALSGDAESVHDLRVAIRRFSRCLSTFSQFYPDGAGRKIRRELADLRDLAGNVRDRHIALELLAAAGISARSAVFMRLDEESRKAGRDLLNEAKRWKASGFSRKWRIKLGLLRPGS